MKCIDEFKEQLLLRVGEMKWMLYEKSSDIVLESPRRVVFTDYYVDMDNPWLGRICPDVVREVTPDGTVTHLLRLADIETDDTFEIELRQAEYEQLIIDIKATSHDMEAAQTLLNVIHRPKSTAQALNYSKQHKGDE